MKQKWFKIEDISKSNYLMLVPIFENYGALIAKQGGSNYFNYVLWIINKGTATLCYLRDDFDKGLNFLFKKTIKNPSWVEKLNRNLVKQTESYLIFAKSLENKNFSKLSNRQLVNVFNELVEYQIKSHSSGQVNTWLIDADHQLFSNYLLNILKGKVRQYKLAINSADAFSKLTTPEKPSFVELESRDSLKIVVLLKNNKQARDIFLRNNVSGIGQQLNKIKPKLRRKIMNHYKKYLWLHYNYEGPILELEYFLEIWKGILKQKNIDELIRQSRTKFVETKEQRKSLFKQLKLDAREKRLFNIAKDIVWLKGWRKDCMYYGSYVLDKIVKEIAKRLELSLKQARFLCYWEVKDVLRKEKYNSQELNERFDFSIIYTDSKKLKVYSGKKAQEFLKRQEFIEQKFKKIDEIEGMCACPGYAKGIIKRVEIVDDLKKMKKGDILISETTYPALVPAMKLASAIITNVGGLTCHAAIVSRELKIPCIVGTKIATKVLHDGDLVEVDADKGVVRILKRK